MHQVYLILSICVFFLIVATTKSKIISGQLITDRNWAFLARFCILSEIGRFTYDISFEAKEINLLLYYDAPDQWPSVYPSTKTCKEKEAVLRRDHGQIITLNVESSKTENSGCNKTLGENITHCSTYREFLSKRPRWWFIVVSNCDSTQGLNITYWISLTNAPPNDFWHHHFSADEFYILPELIAGACIYLILIIISIYCAFELKQRKLLHVTYKLFMISLFAQLCGILSEMISYINRAIHGSDIKFTSLMGNLLEAFAETTFTLMLLLLALGYTVTKSVLNQKDLCKLSYFIIATVALQVMLFTYEAAAFDPGLVLYIYESVPGYGLLFLKIWTWFIFVVLCCRTSKKFVVKFRFYGSLVSLGSGWFLCQPITVLAMTLFVDKWVRESVVKGGNLWVIFVGHVMFLFVTRPSAANSNFPFHIRTCQVVPIGGEGQGHSYEPRMQGAISINNIFQTPPTLSTVSREISDSENHTRRIS